MDKIWKGRKEKDLRGISIEVQDNSMLLFYTHWKTEKISGETLKL